MIAIHVISQEEAIAKRGTGKKVYGCVENRYYNKVYYVDLNDKAMFNAFTKRFKGHLNDDSLNSEVYFSDDFIFSNGRLTIPKGRYVFKFERYGGCTMEQFGNPKELYKVFGKTELIDFCKTARTSNAEGDRT